MASEGSNLFPIAYSYPSFFDHNLVESSRVIRVLKGPHAIDRAFYFQMFKLAFELELEVEIENSEGKIQMVDYAEAMLALIIKATHFKYDLHEDGKTIQSFVGNLQESPDFQALLEQDPRIDKSMLYILAYVSPLPKGTIEECIERLRNLGQYFKINVEVYERCIKFSQSDVFIYFENEEELYLAYMNLDEEDRVREGSESEAAQNIDHPRLPKTQNQNTFEEGQYNDSSLQNALMRGKKKFEQKQSQKQANDTLINIMGDLVSSKGGDSKISNSFVTNNLNSSVTNNIPFTPNRKGREPSPPDDKHNRIEQRPNDQEMNIPFKRESIKSGEDSDVEVFKYSKSNTFNPKNSNSKHSKVDSSEEDIFFHPDKSKDKMLATHLHTISEVTASKESLLQSKFRRKDPLDYDNQEQKGTFYRQFTNTRILSLLPEPHRTKVKMLKNRFIGVHGGVRSSINQF